MATTDYAKYYRDNPDLADHKPAGTSPEDFAKKHWEEHGQREGRASPVQSEKQKKENIEYVRNNPDLRENAEAHGYTADETAKFATWHFDTYGKDESRLNEPGNIRLKSGKDEPLSSKHFGGRDVEKVLQASVRAGDLSELWQAREEIGEGEWKLENFRAAGWNVDPDRPYGRGLLSDDVVVKSGVGQLGVTGDARFLQDRYIDEAIRNDFPPEWIDQATGKWEGPSELAGYWGELTNAIRNEAGELRASRDLPEGPWTDIDPLAVGPRGGPWGVGNLLDGTQGSGWQGKPGGPAGETDFLAYRPGSEAYWQSYLGPELTGSLMRMKQPAIHQASLGYLPGEQRDPINWANYLGFDGKLDKQFQGHIPQGIWTSDPTGYTGLTQPRGNMAGYQGAPWKFAAQPSPMIAQPAWTPYDISPQAAGQWTGLLGDWAAPTLNTTNLLGVA